MFTPLSQSTAQTRQGRLSEGRSCSQSSNQSCVVAVFGISLHHSIAMTQPHTRGHVQCWQPKAVSACASKKPPANLGATFYVGRTRAHAESRPAHHVCPKWISSVPCATALQGCNASSRSGLRQQHPTLGKTAARFKLRELHGCLRNPPAGVVC